MLVGVYIEPGLPVSRRFIIPSRLYGWLQKNQMRGDDPEDYGRF